MIASNYIKHPEALRFQCAMFSNGYHNSPRIMRLMQCIFDQRPNVPQWFKDMRSKAKTLVKKWKKQMVEMFSSEKAKPTNEQRENRKFAPVLHSRTHSADYMQGNGNYRKFCRKCNAWASSTNNWNYTGMA